MRVPVGRWVVRGYGIICGRWWGKGGRGGRARWFVISSFYRVVITTGEKEKGCR